MSKESEYQEIMGTLHRSILRGDMHMYLVKRNDGKQVELVHFQALLRMDTYTSLTIDAPKGEEANDAVLKELLKVSNLVWMSQENGKFMFREVTFENAAAKTDYTFILEKLFKPKTDFRGFNDLTLDAKNPRKLDS